MSAEHLLADFEQTEQLILKEILVLESALESDKVSMNRRSEQHLMAVEDSRSIYLMTTKVRDELAATSIRIQEVHNMIILAWTCR